LHVESLARKHDRRAIRSALNNLPTELDDTYHETLERIYGQNKDDALLAERVLSWISFARRPLVVREMQHAIAVMNLELDESRIDEDGIPDEDLLVAVCAGLVTVDEGNNVIRLVHYTTQQYFERIRDQRFPHAQIAIAQACLRYQSLDIFTDGYCRQPRQLHRRLQTYPLLQYAAQHWGTHARITSEHLLKDQILGFLSEKLRVYCSIQAARHIRYSLWWFENKVYVGDQRLWLVARFGLKEIVQELLKGDVKVEANGPLKETALHVAARNGHTTLVQLLLDHCVDIDARDAFCTTALHDAARRGHEGIVRLLVESGADINAKDDEEVTALYRAVADGKFLMVKLLLELGANPKVGVHSSGLPLNPAAKTGHLAVVQVSLDSNPNASIGPKYPVRALFSAATSEAEAAAEAFPLLMDLCRMNGVDEEVLEKALKVQSGCGARIICDICDAGIPDTDAHYHCNICTEDDFDICQTCVDEGMFCYSGSHALSRRHVVNGDFVELSSGISKEDLARSK
jgi:hypothetical protein